MKIANKINLSFSIVVVILVGISLSILYTAAKNSLEKAIFEHLSTTAQSRARHIETFLEEDKVRMELLAESDGIEEITEEIISNSPNYEELVESASSILKDFMKKEQEAYELLILSPDGKIIASSDEAHIGIDESNEAHFLGGKDRTYIRDAHHSQEQEPGYSISAPIINDDGKEFLGVLVGRFEMDDLNRITTDRSGLGKTGELYLVNKYGYMITHSRFKEDTFLKQKIDTVNYRMSVAAHSGSHPEHGSVRVFSDYRGVSVLGTHDYISEMEWSLLAEIDEKEALAPLAVIKLILIIVFCTVPVVGWIIGMLVSRAITAPIHKLRKGIEIIGEGNLDTQIKIESNDEIGELAQSFNEMTVNLRRTTTSIDTLNAANQQLQANEQQQEILLHDMGKRMKELRCMYDVATSIRTRRRLEEVFEDVVAVLPSGWHYPEITRARIRFDEAEYVSGPFEETPWKLRSGIIIDGEECGSVEVCYLEERPTLDEGAFLKEERSLIDAIAHALSEAAEHVQAEKALYRAKQVAEDTNRQLEESVEHANMLAQEATATSTQLREMQSQIVQSEKLASIGQLAAGVAHEMNTPVGFVASNFETLKSYVGKITKLLGEYDELADNITTSGNTELVNQAAVIADSRRDMKIDFILDDIQDLFDDSKEGLTRVTDIVQNLRDFSRIDQPGSLDKYNINDGIKATLVVAQNEIKYSSDVKTEFSELPDFLCHSGQINQVLLNILLNAAQAITSQERKDRGTITIRIYATETDAVCEISDDGPGIPPDELTRVFDPFFTTKPAGKGTGLGLSVTYDIIVHKHDGELLVESTVGEGTRFTVKLPLGRSDPDYVEEIEDNCIHNKACD